MEGGGESYHYITALNSEALHIETLTAIVRRNIQDWLVEKPMDNEQSYALSHSPDLAYKPKV